MNFKTLIYRMKTYVESYEFVHKSTLIGND